MRMAVSASAQQGLTLLRASTDRFIADDPTTINLVPAKGLPVAKAGGGYDFIAGSARSPQTFKIVSMADSASTTDVEGGQTRVFNYTLVGRHDAVIEIDDVWEDGQNRYRVTGIRPRNGYEVKADVEGVGLDPNYG